LATPATPAAAQANKRVHFEAISIEEDEGEEGSENEGGSSLPE